MLRLLARGLDFPQISKQHGIPVDTARRHLRDAMAHYKAANQTHAVASAIAAEDLPRDVATSQE